MTGVPATAFERIIIYMVATIALLAGLINEPVDLSRVFTKGEKSKYSVEAFLTVEQRQMGLQTFLPSTQEIKYTFTTEVKDLKGDGYCVMRYQRPTMTDILGETATSPPKTRIDKVNLDYQLTVSPINEIIDIKDLAKPDKGKASDLRLIGLSPIARPVALDQLEQFTGEVIRLSVFMGNLESALDFAPKLPFEPVAPGGRSWERTVSYSPQRLKGSSRSAVQKVNMVYTYKGIEEESGKRFHRVNATIKLDTDIAPFVNEMLGMKPEQSGLKSMQLHLDANVDFDLDLNTRRTMKASAKSKGGFKVVLTQRPNEPVEEVRLTGETLMRPVTP